MTVEAGHAVKYRPDIDGLRAVAVVPVCLYHAGLPLFSGGFVGVDVFFVISGYLMASVIGQSLSRDRFSYLDFYERRARRLLPALAVVLVGSLLASSAILLPKLFREFCRGLVATALFASNLLFWRNSANYFEASSELNPLLHTWSLAVEEQFYILFPIYLSLIWRFAPSRKVLFTIAGALASLVFSIWATKNAPTAAFYLLPTRAWEMLLGALVALWSGSHLSVSTGPTARRWAGELGAGCGLCLVIASLLAYNGEMAFPGAAALVPCVGTALIIHFGRDRESFVARLLGRRAFVFIGKVSYSLYLWHWPLLVLLDKYDLFGAPSLARRLGIVAVSFGVATISWRYVEEPFRRSKRIGRARLFSLAAVSMTLIAAAGVAGAASGGWPSRFPGLAAVSLERQAAEEGRNEAWREHEARSECFVTEPSAWSKEQCFLSRHASANALLWGDSFAASYAFGFFENTRAAANVLQFTSPQCPPVRGYDPASAPACGRFNRAIDGVLTQFQIKTVIIAANWSSYLRRRKLTYDDIRATVTFLRSRGVRVVLVGQAPNFSFGYPDEYFFQRFGAGRAEETYSAESTADGKINAELARVVDANEFFDPLSVLCDSNTCVFKEGTRYLFRDYGHYTSFGSQKMVGALMGPFNRVVDHALAGSPPGAVP